MGPRRATPATSLRAADGGSSGACAACVRRGLVAEGTGAKRACPPAGLACGAARTASWAQAQQAVGWAQRPQMYMCMLRLRGSFQAVQAYGFAPTREPIMSRALSLVRDKLVVHLSFVVWLCGVCVQCCFWGPSGVFYAWLPFGKVLAGK